MLSKRNDIFKIGASQVIGSFVLPGEPIDIIYQKTNLKIKLNVVPCTEVVKAIKNKKLDLGFIEFPIFDDSLVYKEWINDKMVVCSKKELPNSLNKKSLNKCRIVCKEKGAHSRKFIENFLEEQGLSIHDFDSISEVDNVTSIVQSIKWSKPHSPTTAIAIISNLAIEYELKYNHLYESCINNTPIHRKFYILYREDSKHIKVIEDICTKLQNT